MQRKISIMACAILAGVALTTHPGCGSSLFPLINVNVPETAQYVLDNVASFIATADDPLETVDPGTVTDDLSGLDGCWGSVFTDSDVDSGPSLYSAYQFDAVAQTYVSWSFIGQRNTGVLWSMMPILTEESGTYEITSDAVITMTITLIRANIDADAATILASLQDFTPDAFNRTRTALITIDGDQMLFFVDVDDAADVDKQNERPIYFKFDCP